MVSKSLTKHSSLWLEDGNIVLIAEDVGFKVVRSMLARSSVIFRDMFSVPQPEAPDELFEGCPLVRLSGDKTEEWKTVLGILFGGGGRDFYKDTISIPFTTVTHAVRLGTKYQFEEIRAEALARLTVCFPKSLEDFHDKVSTTPTHEPPPSVPSTFISPIQLQTNDAAVVLHLSRSLDLNDLIPAAMYTCAQLEVEDLFELYKLGDPPYGLDLGDLQYCLELYAFQQRGGVDPFSFLGEGGVSFACKNELACRRAMSKIFRDVRRNGLFEGRNTLETADHWLVDAEQTYSLCHQCVCHSKAVHAKARKRHWALLCNYCELVSKEHARKTTGDHSDADSQMED